jgi:RNA polymerase sigma-70 factor (ECF subfamily)
VRGTFRGWLKTIARNEIHDYYRRRQHEPQALGGTDGQRFIQELPAGEPDVPEPEAEARDFSHQDVLNRALELVRDNLDRLTWQAFWQTTVLGRSVQDVADELGVTKWAVYKAKQRVLKQIQDAFGDLLD